MFLYFKLNTNAIKSLLLSVAIVFLAFITACIPYSQADSLPVPTFPLSEVEIVNALNESGLLWTVGELREEPVVGNVQVSNFRLYKDTAMIGYIRSTLIDEERSIHIAFLNYSRGALLGRYEMPIAIYTPSKEYWENIIVFITLLFGGFDSSHQIFHHFSNEIDTVTRYSTDYSSEYFAPRFDEHAWWERLINGVYLRIWIVRPVNRQNEYFSDILMISDTSLDWVVDRVTLLE